MRHRFAFSLIALVVLVNHGQNRLEYTDFFFIFPVLRWQVLLKIRVSFLNLQSSEAPPSMLAYWTLDSSDTLTIHYIVCIFVHPAEVSRDVPGSNHRIS